MYRRFAREELTTDRYVLPRLLNALAHAPDDLPSVLGRTADAFDATAAVFVRVHHEQAVAEAVWRSGRDWHGRRVKTDRQPGRVDPAQLATLVAETAAVPGEGSWTAASGFNRSVVLGVRGTKPSRCSIAAAASIVDVLATRAADALGARGDAVLQERARIASAIHDGVSQELATIAVQLEVLAELLRDHPQSHELAALARASAQRAIDNVRASILELTPVVPPKGDPLTGLQALVNEIGRKWAMNVTFGVEGDVRTLDTDAASLASAFVQEGLTNLRKHLRAERAVVTVTFAPEAFRVTVREEGAVNGNRQRIESTGQGLEVMKARARLLDGDVTLVDDPDGSSETTLYIPT